jgi:glycine dehydrogenase
MPDSPKPLADLLTGGEFIARHIGVDAAHEARMLDAIGAKSRRALVEQLVPDSIARRTPMRLPPPLGEVDALAELRAIAKQNRVL